MAVSFLENYLAEHRFAKTRFYWIGFSGAVSLRDQIRKGAFLIRLAIKKGHLSPDGTLLVIGGGVAGVSAAVTARKFGVDVQILERGSRLFLAQSRCETRHLHPNEYEWPRPHFSGLCFPNAVRDKHKKLHPVFRWSAGKPSTIADALKRNYEGLRKAERPPVHCGAEYQIPQNEDEAENLDANENFEMVLFATGGSEDLERNRFKGVPYWASDTVEEPACGCKKEEPLRILVSGAGDGAVQDFLRLTLKLPTGFQPWAAHHTLHFLEKYLRRRSLENAFIKEFGRRNRPFTARKSGVVVRTPVRERCTKVIEDFCAAADERQNLSEAMERLLHPELFEGARTVEVATRSKADFAEVFALNAFLASLVLWAKANVKGLADSAIVTSCRRGVAEIISDPHLCEKKWAECWQHPHEVRFEDGSRSKYDIVILRHGIDDPFRP